MAEYRDSGTRAWRVLSRLLPRTYREAWAQDLWRTHRELRWGAGKGRVAFWLALVWDVVATSVRVRLDGLFGSSGERRRKKRMDATQYTVRLAARGLIRTPGFSLAVVLTLALGLGANATIFTVLDRVLLRPPAQVEAPEMVRRVSVYGQSIFTRTTGYSAALAYPDYRDLEGVRGLMLAAHTSRELTLGSGEASERITAEFATASYFEALGVRAARGRFYGEAEDRIGAETPAVVLSWEFWRRRFGGDPGVLGRQLDIGRGQYTVIGIAPRGFTGVNLGPVDVWLPLHVAGTFESGIDWENARGWYWFGALARLDGTVPEQTVMAEATARYRAGRAQMRSADPNAEVRLLPLIEARGPTPSSESRVTQLLALVALMVLVIACANTANLFLARGLRRRRELAVQSALGVGRGRLVLQLLTEAVLLAGAAGVVAYGLAEVVSPALFRTLLPDDAAIGRGGLRVFVFTTLLATVAVILGGLIPALRAARVDPFEALRTARVSPRSSLLRNSLLALQAALSLLLVIGAGLFLRSLRNASQLGLGVDLETVVLHLELSDGTQGGEALTRVSYPVLERIRTHPAVASATVTSIPPFSGAWGLQVDLPGADSIAAGPDGPFFYAADHDYFGTLGIPIVRGRGFTEADEAASAPPVTVVTRAMARGVWGGEAEALGKCLLILREGDAQCTTVVGIAGDILAGVRSPQPRMYYFLPPRHPGIGFDAAQAVLVKLRPEAAAELPALVALARATSPEIRYIRAERLSAPIALELRPWRLGAVLLTAFGILALAVAGAGLYSVLAFDVAQRRFELGLRSALGAPTGSLIRATVTRSLLVVAAGAALGILAALALSRYAASLLYEVDAVDPLSYAGALIVLGLGALLAAFLPAWRAARTDPRIAMAAD